MRKTASYSSRVLVLPDVRRGGPAFARMWKSGGRAKVFKPTSVERRKAMPKAKEEQRRLEQQVEALEQHLQEAKDRDDDTMPHQERLAAARKDLKDFHERQKKD